MLISVSLDERSRAPERVQTHGRISEPAPRRVMPIGGGILARSERGGQLAAQGMTGGRVRCQTNWAFRVMAGFSALEIGQPVFAVWAASRKSASDAPGTDARTSR